MGCPQLRHFSPEIRLTEPWKLVEKLDSDGTNKIRNYNPHKYDLIRKLMNPYIKLVEKIGDSEISIHEKRKTLQKTQVGETVINLITEVILPYVNELLKPSKAKPNQAG